ncbi:hypothetical protein QBC44DRAFT_76537 [Cladorrhinum sp. PSN332]|nr:hypothetical protein QBC44DRAFT_76537 [Cladorrhinum sp. PSN332]
MKLMIQQRDHGMDCVVGLVISKGLVKVIFLYFASSSRSGSAIRIVSFFPPSGGFFYFFLFRLRKQRDTRGR